MLGFSNRPKYEVKKIIIQNSIKLINNSVIDHELLNKIIYDVGKVTKSPYHLAWSFCYCLLSRK